MNYCCLNWILSAFFYFFYCVFICLSLYLFIFLFQIFQIFLICPFPFIFSFHAFSNSLLIPIELYFSSRQDCSLQINELFFLIFVLRIMDLNEEAQSPNIYYWSPIIEIHVLFIFCQPFLSQLEITHYFFAAAACFQGHKSNQVSINVTEVLNQLQPEFFSFLNYIADPATFLLATFAF